jgi:streptogramin lyase
MQFRIPGVVGVALLALTATASAPAAPTITEYSGGLSTSAAPLSIVTGPEGNLWFTQSGATIAIDRVTPGGVIASYPTKGSSSPSQIVLGPDGKLWFTESGPGTHIGTIDPRSGVVSEYSGAPLLSAAGITAGPEGDLWFAANGFNSTIGRIVPSTGKITEFFPVPLKEGGPTGITVGPEGDLWFTEVTNPGAIGRFDPTAGEFQEYTKGLTANSSPTGITTGPEGNIWFTEATNPGKIGRINPASGTITEFSTGLTVGVPQQIVTGSDGNLYFTESNENGALGRITPTGEMAEYTAGLTPKGEPWGIAAGPDGNIWFTERANPAKVGVLSVTPKPPAASGSPASEIAAVGATLNGTVNPQGVPTTYHFEWGTTTAYGSQLPNPDASAGSGTSTRSVSLPLSGLQPGTTYHYRVVASDCGGCAAGTAAAPDQTFTTQKLITGLGPSSPVAVGAEALAVRPLIGRLAGLEPLSGTILAKIPSSGAFVALKGNQTLPIGTVVDASRGVLRLVTALDTHGKTQSATLWGGLFEVGQSRTGNGMTRLSLRGALPTCAGGARAHMSSAGKRRVKMRKLWAQDEHGRYSTYGASSATTVLGTKWETVDTCAGTLTRVVHGKVRVRDLRRHKTVLVSAGHSYLARS